MSVVVNALKKFFPFWVFIFLFKIGGGMYYTILSPLGERVLPIWVVGLLIGGASAFQMLCDVPAGFLIDRFGHARMLRLTAFFLMVGGSMLFFGLHVWTFVVMICFSALGWLFFEPGINAYLLSYAPKAHAGRFVSLREIASSSGLFLASIAVPFVLALPLFYLAAIIVVFLAGTIFSALFLRSQGRSGHLEQKIEAHHYYIRRHYLHRVLGAIRELNPASTLLTLVNFSGAVFYGILWFTIPLVIAHRIEQGGALGLGLSVLDFASLVAGGLFGHLVDHSDKKNLIFIGLLIFALTGMALGLNFGIWFLVFGFLATAGDQLASISLWAWLNQLDRQHAHDGLIAGVVTFFEDAGWAVGPMLGGLLYGTVGPSWTIIIGSCFIFVTWIVSSVLLRKPTPLFISSATALSHRPYRSRGKR